MPECLLSGLSQKTFDGLARVPALGDWVPRRGGLGNRVPSPALHFYDGHSGYSERMGGAQKELGTGRAASCQWWLARADKNQSRSKQEKINKAVSAWPENLSNTGTSLVVQGLRHHAPRAGGLTPTQETRSPMSQQRLRYKYFFKKRKENLSDAGEKEEERSSEWLQYFISSGGHRHDHHQNNKHHNKQPHLRKLLYNNSLSLGLHLLLTSHFETGMTNLTEEDIRTEPYPRYTAN